MRAQHRCIIQVNASDLQTSLGVTLALLISGIKRICTAISLRFSRKLLCVSTVGKRPLNRFCTTHLFIIDGTKKAVNLKCHMTCDLHRQ